MRVERFATKACCGQMGTTFKLEKVLSTNILALLTNKGYKEIPAFTAANILYCESKEIIATGAFNNNILQIKCKVPGSCATFINAIEEILINAE
jgi:hypothetical protein